MPTPTQRYYSSVAQQTTVTGALTNTVTTVPVAATTGFPATPFCAAIDYGTASEELVLVTNISGLNLTVTRGFSGSSAVAHATNAVFQHVHVSQDFTDFSQHLFSVNGVHGVTGNVVGTTDAQTLSNKTLVSPVITGNLNLSTIDDSNGNPAINIGATAAAVNQITVTDAATGTAPSIAATGSDTNIDLNLQSKGTGVVKHNGIASVDVSTAQTLTNKTLTAATLTNPKVNQVLDSNGNVMLYLAGAASAVNSLQFANAPTGGTPSVQAGGSDTNVGLNLVTQGSGTVQANGINLADVSSAQTLSNKTLAGAILTGALSGTGIINSITTSSNPGGTAGGTFYLANIGGLKVMWGKTATISGSTSYTINLPAFFNNIQAVLATGVAGFWAAQVNSSTSLTIGTSAGAAATTVSVFAIGN